MGGRVCAQEVVARTKAKDNKLVIETRRDFVMGFPFGEFDDAGWMLDKGFEIQELRLDSLRQNALTPQTCECRCVVIRLAGIDTVPRKFRPQELVDNGN